MNSGPNRHQAFPETRWSLVLRAGSDDNEAKNAALTDLYSLYWPPVYAYVRSRGHSPHDAEDHVQGFFVMLMERDDLCKPDASRGKLRSYLLGAVKHYLASERRHAARQKRGGDALHFSIDAATGESHCLFVEPTDEITPDRIFDRQWATTLMENVVRVIETDYQNSGRAQVFEVLRPFLAGGSEAGETARAARALGLSENAMRVALHRLRQRYANELRQMVADTLEDGENIEAELGHLMNSFRY